MRDESSADHISLSDRELNEPRTSLFLGRIIPLIGLVFIMGIIGLVLYSMLGPSGRGRGPSAFGINNDGGLVQLKQRRADDLTLDLFSGETVELADLRGQVIVVNFWASWCPPCREEAAALEIAWQDLKDEGVVFLGIDVWDERSDALAFIDEFNVSYLNGLDRSGTITVSYGIKGIPETFIIDQNGQLVSKFVGPVITGDLIGEIRKVVEGTSQ